MVLPKSQHFLAWDVDSKGFIIEKPQVLSETPCKKSCPGLRNWKAPDKTPKCWKN